ncbi:acyltransferase family protein [Aliamphritea hakodatensis]|uniref:acyltransferase family protein n=1 Tax=Aliamphritea hakodatensis TaxID=2895352 RepID=UPI0022FD7ED0|nr:acyltransferase family protein [Aliamphritea hakodatensis]
MNFRSDINGLRAIAVISVVLFHFGFDFFQGGFAGVDIFFVISGYLMTGIIINGLEDNRFTLINFYHSRAKRIIPPLVVLSLVILPIGYYFLIRPEDFTSLSKHVYSSLGFFSNHIYLSESGYFDVAPQDKWLLHTWSLSVEWQFYMIYPILLILLYKTTSINKIKITLGILFALSFILSVIATTNWPTHSYYLLPTRAWEMILGALAFLYPIQLNKNSKLAFETTGLALILLSITLISSDTPWPGYMAGLPVIGTYLIIVANRQNSLITNNIVMRPIGKWSYSIYLWHWPIVSLSYFIGVNNNPTYKVPLILLSLLLGYISYKLIEQRLSLKNTAFILLATFSSSLLIYNYSPEPNRHQYLEDIVTSIKTKKYQCFDEIGKHADNHVACQLTTGNKRLMALGDSHMNSSLPVIEKIAKESDYELFYAGFSGCPPLIGAYPVRSDQDKKNCKILNEKAINFAVENNIDTVFLAARWTYYTIGDYNRGYFQFLRKTDDITTRKNRQSSAQALEHGLETTLTEYKNKGIKVLILLQVPMQTKGPDKAYSSSLSMSNKIDIDLLNKNSVSKELHNALQKETNTIIKNVSRNFNNVTLIDPTDIYCGSEQCLIGDKNNSFYSDDDHLSVIGSYKLQSMLEKNLAINK